MRRPVSRRQLSLLLALGALVASACGPTYPACNNDEDCNKDKPRHEFCVNQTCQQCRRDDDCGAGKQCQKGRCAEIPGYCDDDSQCSGGTTCVKHRCRPCASDDQCGEGGKCRQGRCLRKGMCDSDDDCPQDMDCKGGKCVGGAPPKANQNASCSLSSIYFDFNEFVLTTDASSTIERDATCIKQVGRPVQIIGRSDPRGTEEYNLALSEKRAQQVKDQLHRLGVDASKMHTLPKGELEATGHDEAGWAQDRRVDFEWM